MTPTRSAYIIFAVTDAILTPTFWLNHKAMASMDRLEGVHRTSTTIALAAAGACLILCVLSVILAWRSNK